MTDRRMIVTVVVSLVLHALAVTALLLFLHAGATKPAEPDQPTEVELVMEEHRGDLQPAATPSPPARPPAEAKPEVQPQETSQEEQKPEEAKTEAPPVQAPVEAQPDAREEVAEPPKRSDEPSKQAESEKPVTVAPPEQPPEPPVTQTAPTITLHGTDSPSEARAYGDHILPAAPDAVFHNRPPEYPFEAARNGEQGSVVVVVHVSPAGLAARVDVVSSSGYVLLDRAAREAVLRWRFLPAVKDGEPVASDMAMQFVFENR
jgi:protein TonB